MRLINFLGLARRKRRSGAAFSPLTLFSSGEQGAWYDPSDLSTMFTDTAGTTPATVGDPVARINDKSGRGNHATQDVLARRPILARVPEMGRRNLLQRTEEFDNAFWTKLAATVTPNDTTAPDGTITADKLTVSSAGGTGFSRIQRFIITSLSTQHVSTVYAKAGTLDFIYFQMQGFTSPASGGAWFNVRTGTVGTVRTGFAAEIEDAGSGWYRCTLKWTTGASDPDGNFEVFAAASNGSEITTQNGTDHVFIWGAQLETGPTATTYQRVGSTFDVTEAGVPSLNYLSFDGIDDFLVTPTITPGVDKAQVFAGVRKLSDASRRIVIEHSASIAANDGALAITAPDGASATFALESKGTVLSSAVDTGIAAPASRVICGLGDIAGDLATLRINGVQEAQSTADQGTGNYLAYPMYIGARAGTSLFLSGHIYNLIVRFGANLDAPTIANVEGYVAGRTGVTL